MKLGAIIGGLVGLALAGWLLADFGFARILDLLNHAGWLGIGLVIVFHLPQMLFSAAGWRVLAGPVPNRPRIAGFTLLRWVREAVNNLLPVAQIGGEFAVARLLCRRGMNLATATACTVADLTMEMVTQILFTVLGLGLLVAGTSVGAGSERVVMSLSGGLIVAVMLVGGLLGAQWFGLAALIEKGLIRLGRPLGWTGMDKVAGLHDALRACYRQPGRVAVSAFCHLMSWLLGGIEVQLALHFLGHDIGVGPGLIIESLGQALKAVGFAVPGALGVQEGGLIMVCRLYGLSPDVAIALSLMKRLREVALGVPGLLMWQLLERRDSRSMALVPGAAS